MENEKELKAIGVLLKYYKEIEDSYNIWLEEYDKTSSITSEEQLLQTKQKMILLSRIIEDIQKCLIPLDPDKRYDE